MAHYERVRIGEALISRMIAKLEGGGCVVLLGPREVGKLYALHRACERLSGGGVGGLVALVRFPTITMPALAEARGGDQLHGMDGLRTDRVVRLAPDIRSVLDWIDEQEVSRPKILVATNVDATLSSSYDVREFLQELRRRWERHREAGGGLGLALSGETDILEFLQGWDAGAGTIAPSFLVAQGYDWETFRAQFHDRYWRGEIEGFEERARTLYDQTGGNGFLLRMNVLQSDRADLQQYLEPYLANSVKSIEASSKIWPDLEILLGGGTIEPPGAEPHPLELAGIASLRDQDGRLGFTSTQIERIVRGQYPNRRLADLYALDGNVEAALKRYQSLELRNRVRPDSAMGDADAERVVVALCDRIASLSGTDRDEARRLFVAGVHYILGFPEVRFCLWRGPAAGWEVGSDFISSGYEGAMFPVPLPPPPPNLGAAALELPEAHRASTLAWSYPGDLEADRWAVIVRDGFGTDIALLRRRELLDRLMRRFAEEATAAEAERRQRRWQRQADYGRIVSRIFAKLGTSVSNVQQTLTMAARGLRKIGYRRILFCLVDADGKRLRAQVEKCAPGLSRIMDCRAEWRLDEGASDIQASAALYNQVEPVEDSSLHPRTDKKVVAYAGIKAGAVLPIATRRSTRKTGDLAGTEQPNRPPPEVVGTIHVERNDCMPLDREEIQELLVFGHELAVAIEQSDRTRVLKSVLDRLDDAILIFDPSADGQGLGLRYVNRRAGDLLGGIKPKWYRGRFAPALDHDFAAMPQLGRDIQALASEVLRHDSRSRTCIFADNDGEHNYQATAFRIDSASSEQFPAVRIREVTLPLRVVHCTKETAENALTARSVARHAFEMLGTLKTFQWGRLYLNEQVDGVERLVLDRSFQITDEDGIREVRTSPGGQFALRPRGEASAETYRSLIRGRPIVFRKMPPGGRCHYWNSHGLKMICVEETSCPQGLEKEDGECWIDFPLKTSDREIIGKMSLQCPLEYGADEFEILRLFCVIVRSMLANARRWESKEKWIERAAEIAISQTSHSLKNRIGALSYLLIRYRRQEQTVPSIRTLNDELERIRDTAREVFTRAHFLLMPARERLDVRRVDLVRLVRDTLAERCPDAYWTLHADPETIPADIDAHLLGLGLAELIDNSIKAADPTQGGRINVRVSVVEVEERPVICITFADNGPGIPSENRERIFSNFFSNWPGQVLSTGLGLGFLRRVIEAHEGRIEEKSTPGLGAEFAIEIPRWFHPTSRSSEGAPHDAPTDQHPQAELFIRRG